MEDKLSMPSSGGSPYKKNKSLRLLARSVLPEIVLHVFVIFIHLLAIVVDEGVLDIKYCNIALQGSTDPIILFSFKRVYQDDFAEFTKTIFLCFS